MNQIVNGSLTIRWQPRVCVVTIRNDRGRRRHIGSPPVQVVTSRMPATVDSSTDAERELDTETAADQPNAWVEAHAMLSKK